MSSPPTGPPDATTRFASLYEHVYADLLRFVERRAHRSHAEDHLPASPVATTHSAERSTSDVQ